jgi:hypothetical protein
MAFSVRDQLEEEECLSLVGGWGGEGGDGVGGWGENSPKAATVLRLFSREQVECTHMLRTGKPCFPLLEKGVTHREQKVPDRRRQVPAQLGLGWK